MSRQASLRLLALALLLPASAAAVTPWDCIQLADGQWRCTGKTPPAADSGPQAEPTGEDSKTAGSVETAPAAAGETGAIGKDSAPPEPETGASGEPPAAPAVAVPAQTPRKAVTPTPAAAPAPEVAAPARAPAAETVTPPDGAARPPAPAGDGADSDEQAGPDRWALCPPVTQPAALPLPAPGTDTIHLQADSAMASEDGVYTLKGNAVVQYAGQRLEAKDIVYRQENGMIEALDGIRYTGPALYVSGDLAYVSTEAQIGELRGIKYYLYEQHGRGAAEKLRLEGVAEQRMRNAFYTTCPEGDEDWVLSAREVELNQIDGTGTAQNAKLTFKDVPVMYLPWVTFPIDDRRKSGLLVPKIGQADETGFDASVPVYWNIAPDRDMTVTPRYMSDRGTMLGAEFRYLNRHNFGKLTGEYLPADKLRDDEARSLVSIQHQGNPWPRLQTRVIASNVSDENYFEDLGSNLVQTSQTNLQRTAEAAYHGNWWQLGMRVQDFQTIDPTVSSEDRPYKQLPQVAFSAAPAQRLLGMQFEAGAEAIYFKHSDSNVVEGSRVDILPRISLPVHRAAWYVEPSVGVRYTAYDLANLQPGEKGNPTRTTPIASLDAGTFFERNGRWGETDYVQTLEPRLYYLYVPYRNQDELPVFDTGDYDFNFWTLFRDNRFSGPDRQGDANQLALALTTRILDPASGRQALRASLGTLLYFSDREVTLPGDPVETDNSSDLIGEIGLALARHWNADAELQWDPHDSTTSRNDYRLQYRRGPRQLVNLSYRQREGSHEQTDMSFLWPLSPRWHLVGRWYYDLDARQIIETLGGVGYESCCWGIQLVARSYIHNTEDERNTSVFLQVELKGLGRLGTKVDDALERGILGYEAGY